ncbi:MAG: exodeoxyribonuclease III [Gammaproteobacteria bacterium CG22_combo_CG10-13_8_21_14_all_40_8]|nr:MAG: exodeoxyribonuclease III [Gammaproteobacteria bacterium CG22_combo_CG10-13_8_21_14_all_40_8]
MKIVCFNVNGIRARLHQIEEVISTLSPDVIAIQEVKAQDSDFPFAEIKKYGYHCETFGQKGHYGVAFLSKKPPVKIQRGFPFDVEDAQKRLITGYFLSDTNEEFILVNGYFPQGDSRSHEWKFPYKQKFYSDLSSWLQQSFDPTQNIVVMGDFNIASTDADIGIGEANAKRWLKTGKCSFLPEEREWFQTLLDFGLTDAFRHLNPAEEHCLNVGKLSWFDYRSKGFDDEPKRGLRIDGFLVSSPLVPKITAVDISYEIRAMDKPSDHAPLWIDFQ